MFANKRLQLENILDYIQVRLIRFRTECFNKIKIFLIVQSQKLCLLKL